MHLWDSASCKLRPQPAEASATDGLAGKGSATRRRGSSSQEKGNSRYWSVIAKFIYKNLGKLAEEQGD